MTTEEKLKDYILRRYNSLREFTIAVDMSYSTVDSILKRGVDTASVANIIKICKALGISVDELANGNITPINISKDPKIEITEILSDVKNQLIASDGLTFEGDPANRESINAIVQAMIVGEEMAKKQKNS